MVSAAQNIIIDEIECRVVKKRRLKAASIRIRDAVVTVTVPHQFCMNDLNDLIFKRRRWISTKLSEQRQAKLASHRMFVTGEYFPYLGRWYQLRVIANSREKITLKNDDLLLNLKSEESELVRSHLIRWYKNQAEHYVLPKVDYFKDSLAVKPKGVTIKTYRARWGTCYRDGRISYNWKLIMMPSEIIDYVIVHELCHLIHFDHSKSFWHEVSSVFPNYPNAVKWLKHEAKKMDYF